MTAAMACASPAETSRLLAAAFHAGSIRPAARAAGIDRVHLYRLLTRHGRGRG